MTRRAAVIMAAGQGTRMKSPIPKVLHKVGGRAILAIELSRLPVKLVGKVGRSAKNQPNQHKDDERSHDRMFQACASRRH